MNDITPRDPTETRALGIGARIATVIALLAAAVPALLAAVGGLDWITANLPLLATGLGSLITGGLASYIAIRRMRVDASKAGLLLLPVLIPALLLTGCAMTFNSTPIMSDSDGETVVASATTLKIGLGTKEATTIGAYKLSADGGLSIDNLDTKSDSSAVLLQAITLGAQLGAGRLGVPLTVREDSAAQAPSDMSSPSDPSDAPIAYSPEGYTGVPGPVGEGVYGWPACSRCRAYLADHPEAKIINIDDPGNRADMWTALRLRGYTAATAPLPILITATAYTTSAR